MDLILVSAAHLRHTAEPSFIRPNGAGVQAILTSHFAFSRERRISSMLEIFWEAWQVPQVCAQRKASGVGLRNSRDFGNKMAAPGG